MLLSIGLQKSLFFVNIPTQIFGDFWYVIEDMFLDQNPLRNILLQLVTGWPTFVDKMPGLKHDEQENIDKRVDIFHNLNGILAKTRNLIF